MQAEAALNGGCTQRGADGAPEPTKGRAVLEPLLIPSPTDFKPGRPDSTSAYAAGPSSGSCRSVPLERARSRM